MGVPIIFNGNFAKLLKASLKFGVTARIITIAVDPTVVATDGEAGSIAMRNNGSIYIKQDAGITINWVSAVFDPNTIVTDGVNVLVDAFGNVIIA